MPPTRHLIKFGFISSTRIWRPARAVNNWMDSQHISKGMVSSKSWEKQLFNPISVTGIASWATRSLNYQMYASDAPFCNELKLISSTRIWRPAWADNNWMDSQLISKCMVSSKSWERQLFNPTSLTGIASWATRSLNYQMYASDAPFCKIKIHFLNSNLKACSGRQ